MLKVKRKHSHSDKEMYMDPNRLPWTPPTKLYIQFTTLHVQFTIINSFLCSFMSVTLDLLTSPLF